MCQDGKQDLGHPAGTAALAGRGRARCQLLPVRARSRVGQGQGQTKAFPRDESEDTDPADTPLLEMGEKCLGRAQWWDRVFFVTRNFVSRG